MQASSGGGAVARHRLPPENAAIEGNSALFPRTNREGKRCPEPSLRDGLDACFRPRLRRASSGVKMAHKEGNRTIKLTIRVTPAERDEIARRAGEAGVRQPMRYVRETALRRLRHSTDRAAIVQLVRIGNNLNQLVRILHAARAGSPKRLVSEVEDRLENIDVLIHQLLTKVETLRIGTPEDEPEVQQ